MENLPFDTVGLSADEVEILEESYRALKSSVNINLYCDHDFQLAQFDLLSHYNDTSIGGVFEVNNFHLVFIKIHYFFRNIKGGMDADYYKYQVCALIKLNKDFGRILIRRETFTDKITELLHPIELDFSDDKAFSDKFYILTNDKDKAQLNMTWNFRSAIMNMRDDFGIEIVNDSLLIYNDQALNAEDAVYLTSFAAKIAALR